MSITRDRIISSILSSLLGIFIVIGFHVGASALTAQSDPGDTSGDTSASGDTSDSFYKILSEASTTSDAGAADDASSSKGSNGRTGFDGTQDVRDQSDPALGLDPPAPDEQSFRPKAILTKWLMPTVMTKITKTNGGLESNGKSWGPSISADGSKVAYFSMASNLLSTISDPEALIDVGAFVGDYSPAEAGTNIFVSDVKTNYTKRLPLSHPVGDDGFLVISPDANHVAFHTGSPLDPGDNDDNKDIYVHNLETGKTTLVSKEFVGNYPTETKDFVRPGISADGRYITFQDENFRSAVYVWDRTIKKSKRVSRNARSPGINGNGRYITFISSETNQGIKLHDEGALFPNRISEVLSWGYTLKSQHLSIDGWFIIFESWAYGGGLNLYVHNRGTGETDFIAKKYVSDDRGGNISSGNHPCAVWADLDHVRVYCQESGERRVVSMATDGTLANKRSEDPVISADRKYIAFSSRATNLVAGDTDTNERWDIFVTPNLLPEVW